MQLMQITFIKQIEYRAAIPYVYLQVWYLRLINYA